jgi:hypothetical protein
MYRSAKAEKCLLRETVRGVTDSLAFASRYKEGFASLHTGDMASRRTGDAHARWCVVAYGAALRIVSCRRLRADRP